VTGEPLPIEQFRKAGDTLLRTLRAAGFDGVDVGGTFETCHVFGVHSSQVERLTELIRRGVESERRAQRRRRAA
jgi:hypothetical protein